MARIITTTSTTSTTNGEGFAAATNDAQNTETRRGKSKRTDNQGAQKTFTSARQGAQLTITIEL